MLITPKTINLNSISTEHTLSCYAVVHGDIAMKKDEEENMFEHLKQKKTDFFFV